jgi:outer membrane protein assembly factor BamB
MTKEPPASKRRLIFPLLVVALAAAIWIGVGSIDGMSRQEQTFARAGISLLSALLLFVWWIAFSRFTWQTRRVGVAVVILAFSGLVATVRFRGFSGDMEPIFELRHTVPAAPTLKPNGPAADRVRVGEFPNFPQYLGATRDCRVPFPDLETDWQKHPPQIVWRVPVGASWSGFIVADGALFTQEQSGDEELVTCREIQTGALRWQHADKASYSTPIAGDGPRSTPTWATGKLFSLGGTGIVNCINAETGRLLWSYQLTPETSVPDWGFTGSPLVFGDLVYVMGGGTAKDAVLPQPCGVVALRIQDGTVAWKAGTRAASYSAPTLVRLGGADQLLAIRHNGISAFDPTSGRTLWDRPFGRDYPLVAQPVPVPGSSDLILSAGYGVGSCRLSVARHGESDWSVEERWKSARLKAKFSNFVVDNDAVYGIDDGVFTAISPEDGGRLWRGEKTGHGQLLWNGRWMLLTTEQGELVLARPTPQTANVVARARVFDGKLWNPPAISGQTIFLRTEREAVCLRLPLPPATGG